MPRFYWARLQGKASTSHVGTTVLATGVLLASLSASAAPDSAPASRDAAVTRAAPVQAVARVTIADFAFSPATLMVPAGTELVWTNRDDAPHTVKGVGSDSPIASQPLDTGDRYSVVMRRPGRYEYFCTLHPIMVGTIIVE